jgi:hypothetical protein
MEPQALQDAKAAKRQEIFAAAEEAYWDAWGREESAPFMLKDWCLIWAPRLGQTLSARNQQSVADARAVYPKTAQLVQAINAATTVEEVAAIQW